MQAYQISFDCLNEMSCHFFPILTFTKCSGKDYFILIFAPKTTLIELRGFLFCFFHHTMRVRHEKFFMKNRKQQIISYGTVTN